MVTKVLFSSLFGVAIASSGTGDGEVLVGTDAGLAAMLESNPEGALVEFYAPWCGHCKKLEPEYTKAAEQLKEDGVTIPLIKVDATVETKLAEKHGVQGYPTLKWFVGGEPSEYDGPRDAKGIVSWIKQVSGPAVLREDVKDTDTFSILYSAPTEPEWYESFAKTNRKKGTFYYAAGDAKVVMKHLGEDAIEKAGEVEKADLETMLKDNGFPLYGALDGDTFSTYIERGNGMVWTLMKMGTDDVKEVVEESRERMTNVAKELGSKYSVTWTNTNEFGKVLENMFGITEFPKLVVQKKAGDKKNYIYDGEMDEASIKKYMKDVEDGTVEPTLKSEPVPEEPQTDPVKVVVGKNLEKLVFTEDKDVLLEIYAPWCGHCKKLEPEYIKVGKKVQKEGFEDILTIAKMDGTANDSPVDSLSYSGFPTIYYIKAGNKEPMKYDGARDAKGIWKWIKKNHSKADEIKEKIASKKKDKEEL